MEKVDRLDWLALPLFALAAYLGPLEMAHGAYWARSLWPEWSGQYMFYFGIAGIALGLLAIVFPRRERAKEWWVDDETGAKKRITQRTGGQVYTNPNDNWAMRSGRWATNHRGVQSYVWLFLLVWLLAPALMNLNPADGPQPETLDRAGLILWWVRGAAALAGSGIDYMWWAFNFASPFALLMWANSLRRRADHGPDEYRAVASPFGSQTPATPASLDEHLR